MSALEKLVAACEDSFAGPKMDAYPDEEDVGEPPIGLTFGMIRDARAELTALSA